MSQNSSDMKRRLTFSTSTELVRIAPEGLVYISADGNYCTILMADGEARLQTKKVKEYNLFKLDEMLEDRGIDKEQLVVAPSDILKSDMVYKL